VLAAAEPHHLDLKMVRHDQAGAFSIISLPDSMGAAARPASKELISAGWNFRCVVKASLSRGGSDWAESSGPTMTVVKMAIANNK